ASSTRRRARTGCAATSAARKRHGALDAPLARRMTAAGSWLCSRGAALVPSPRSYRISQPVSRVPVDGQIVAQHHAVVFACRTRRYELFLDVAAHRRHLALERIAPAAAAAGAHDYLRRNRNRMLCAAGRVEFARARLAQPIGAVLPG